MVKSNVIQDRLDILNELVIDLNTFEEFVEEAQSVKNDVVLSIQKALTVRLAFENEQADLKIEQEHQAKVKAEQEAAAAKIKAAQDKIDDDNQKIQEAIALKNQYKEKLTQFKKPSLHRKRSRQSGYGQSRLGG